VLETVSYVKSGKLRALAVTGPARSPVLPDVPTLTEAGVKNADSGSWTAVMAPAGTPQAVVDKLSAAIREVADKPSVRDKLVGQGAVAHGSTPDALRQIAQRDRERYGTIIRERKLRAE